MYLDYCGKCGAPTTYIMGKSSWTNLRFCSTLTCDNAVFTIVGDSMGGSSSRHYSVVLTEEERKLLFILHDADARFDDTGSPDMHAYLANTVVPEYEVNQLTPQVAKGAPQIALKSSRIYGEKVYKNRVLSVEPEYYIGKLCPVCNAERIKFDNKLGLHHVYCENSKCWYDETE